MSVLVEAISVIVRKPAIEARFPRGLTGFTENVPNQTYCHDGDLVRVGFMAPQDVQDFVGQLEACGLVYLQNGHPQDIAVVDQLRGPTIECEWVRLARLQNDDGSIVVACLVNDENPEQVAVPTGWKFSGSLSQRHTFVSSDEIDDRLESVSSDSGISAFRDRETGEKVFMGSPMQEDRSKEFEQIQAIVHRTLDLDAMGDRAKQRRDIKAGEAVFDELVNDLLPRAMQMTLHSKFHAGFAHFAYGLLLRVSGQQQEAVEQFRKSLSHSPNTLNTLLEITRCLGESDNHSEAMGFAQKAVEVEPTSSQAWGNLAMVLIQLGEMESAGDAINEALAIEPECPVNKNIKALFDHNFGEA